MKRNLLYGTVIAVILASCVSAVYANKRVRHKIDTSTDDELDLERYMGLWYEIARMDHPFERGMSHVTAFYTLMKDGSVEVCNDGINERKMKYRKIIGKAVIPNAARPRRLRVSFFPLVYSDYNILKITDNYSCVLVGGKGPGYLWILSRTPNISTAIYSDMLHEAARRGYDVNKLILVNQR